MDDFEELTIPDCLPAVWNTDLSDLPFTASYFDNIGGDGGDLYNYAMGDGVNDEVHCCPDYLGGAFGIQQSTHQLGLGKADNQNTKILTPDLPFSARELDLETEKAFTQSPSSCLGLSQVPATQIIATHGLGLVFNYDGFQSPLLDYVNPANQAHSRLVTPSETTSDRISTTVHGQITPGASPETKFFNGRQDSDKSQASCSDKTPVARKKRCSIVAKIKNDAEAPAKPAKKPRRSKKKPLSQEEQQAKRGRFLERNRIAADKCRQNRKTWIDDLQAKCHEYSAEKAIKNAAVKEMEQKIIQLKSLLLAHSQSCKDDKLITWVEGGAKRPTDQHTMSQLEQKTLLVPEFLLSEDGSPDSQRRETQSSIPSKLESESKSAM